jgi:hypothetical protein
MTITSLQTRPGASVNAQLPDHVLFYLKTFLKNRSFFTGETWTPEPPHRFHTKSPVHPGLLSNTLSQEVSSLLGTNPEAFMNEAKTSLKLEWTVPSVSPRVLF